MAATNHTLEQYLSQRPPVLTAVQLSSSDKNTTNEAYSYEEIEHVGVWADFTRTQMVHDYQPLLQMAMNVNIPPMPRHPQPITAEVGLRSALDVYLKERVREGLRFALIPQNRPAGHHYDSLDFGVGKLAQCPGRFEPDTAFFERGPDGPTEIKQRVNRCPGDLKPSWKFSHGMINHTYPHYDEEARQVLSQLNKYMNDNHTKYGYILTDVHMVAVRKTNHEGHLEVSAPIPWDDPNGNNAFGALIALWYLGMIAARRGGWHAANAPPHDTHAQGDARRGHHKDSSNKSDPSNKPRDRHPDSSKPKDEARTGGTGKTGRQRGADKHVATKIALHPKSREHGQGKELVKGRKRDAE